jgi:Rieske Fe-S protein
VYDAQTGIAISGPALRPLDYMPITITNGNIVVNTAKIMTRAAFDAGQTVSLG